MMDVGIYVVQGACMAQDDAPPVAVTAHEPKKARPELFTEVEESMEWTMEFGHGAVLHGSAGFDRNAGEFKVEGPDGWIDFPKNAFGYTDAHCRTSRGPFPVTQQTLQMDDFADCILTGRQTPVPGEMGRRDIRILLAIYEAARTGKRVPL
jgi:glucose-fructose oxidoreductase